MVLLFCFEVRSRPPRSPRPSTPCPWAAKIRGCLRVGASRCGALDAPGDLVDHFATEWSTTWSFEIGDCMWLWFVLVLFVRLTSIARWWCLAWLALERVHLGTFSQDTTTFSPETIRCLGREIEGANFPMLRKYEILEDKKTTKGQMWHFCASFQVPNAKFWGFSDEQSICVEVWVAWSLPGGVSWHIEYIIRFDASGLIVSVGTVVRLDTIGLGDTELDQEGLWESLSLLKFDVCGGQSSCQHPWFCHLESTFSCRYVHLYRFAILCLSSNM